VDGRCRDCDAWLVAARPPAQAVAHP